MKIRVHKTKARHQQNIFRNSRCPEKHLGSVRNFLDDAECWRQEDSEFQTFLTCQINHMNALIQKLRPVEMTSQACVNQLESKNFEREIASLLENKFQFYEEEIFIKVESMKAQIDTFRKVLLKNFNLKMRKENSNQQESFKLLRFYETTLSYHYGNQKRPLKFIKMENVIDLKLIAYFYLPSMCQVNRIRSYWIFFQLNFFI